MREWILASRPWPVPASIAAAVALAALAGWGTYWRWVQSLDGSAGWGAALAGGFFVAVFTLTLRWSRRAPNSSH